MESSKNINIFFFQNGPFSQNTFNLTRQLVCYTQPSGKSSLETAWKRAGTLRKYLAGDEPTVYHCLSHSALLEGNIFSIVKSLQCRSLFFPQCSGITDALAALMLTSFGAAIVGLERSAGSRYCLTWTKCWFVQSTEDQRSKWMGTPILLTPNMCWHLYKDICLSVYALHSSEL